MVEFDETMIALEALRATSFSSPSSRKEFVKGRPTALARDFDDDRAAVLVVTRGQSVWEMTVVHFDFIDGDWVDAGLAGTAARDLPIDPKSRSDRQSTPVVFAEGYPDSGLGVVRVGTFANPRSCTAELRSTEAIRRVVIDSPSGAYVIIARSNQRGAQPIVLRELDSAGTELYRRELK